MHVTNSAFDAFPKVRRAGDGDKQHGIGDVVADLNVRAWMRPGALSLAEVEDAARMFTELADEMRKYTREASPETLKGSLIIGAKMRDGKTLILTGLVLDGERQLSAVQLSAKPWREDQLTPARMTVTASSAATVDGGQIDGALVGRKVLDVRDEDVQVELELDDGNTVSFAAEHGYVLSFPCSPYTEDTAPSSEASPPQAAFTPAAARRAQLRAERIKGTPVTVMTADELSPELRARYGL